jgi:hypothetical protein
MKLQTLNVKKLRKRSIARIRELLKLYGIRYSIMDDKDKLIDRLMEIQFFSRKVKIYRRYDLTF